MSETPSIINNENVINAKRQWQIISSLNNKFCKEFPYLVLKGNLDYKSSLYIPISPARCFNQRLLNFNQYFVSNINYVFFTRSAYEQCLLRSSTSFAMHQSKASTSTAGTVKSNFKGAIQRFVVRDNGFSFMSLVKGNPAYWKQFYIMY